LFPNFCFFFFAAKKEAEECKQKLTDLLNNAKSIAPLTPDLQKEFLEVCIRYSIVVYILVLNIYVAITNLVQKVILTGLDNTFCCLHILKLIRERLYEHKSIIFHICLSSIIEKPNEKHDDRGNFSCI
jgi:hypothetical protein